MGLRHFGSEVIDGCKFIECDETNSTVIFKTIHEVNNGLLDCFELSFANANIHNEKVSQLLAAFSDSFSPDKRTVVQAHLLRITLFGQIIWRQAIECLADAASVLNLIEMNAIVRVHEGLAFLALRRRVIDDGVFPLLEWRVVQCLRNCYFGLEKTIGRHNVPNYPD